jgi:hypothetical protein
MFLKKLCLIVGPQEVAEAIVQEVLTRILPLEILIFFGGTGVCSQGLRLA